MSYPQLTSLYPINYTKEIIINIARRQCKYIEKIQLTGEAKTTECHLDIYKKKRPRT